MYFLLRKNAPLGCALVREEKSRKRWHSVRECAKAHSLFRFLTAHFWNVLLTDQRQNGIIKDGKLYIIIEKNKA